MDEHLTSIKRSFIQVSYQQTIIVYANISTYTSTSQQIQKRTLRNKIYPMIEIHANVHVMIRRYHNQCSKFRVCSPSTKSEKDQTFYCLSRIHVSAKRCYSTKSILIISESSAISSSICLACRHFISVVSNKVTLPS